MFRLIITCIFIFTISSFVLSQVSINEYSASNLNNYQDSYGKSEDWIELYNESDVPVDIGLWHLSDKLDKPKKWIVPEGIVIPANGFLILWCSGRDINKGGELHTNFKLTQTSGDDVILLADADGNVIESTSLELTLVEHSRCKEIDGGDEWRISTSPTHNSTNNTIRKYRGYSQTPSIDVEAGFYMDSISVSIANNEPNSILRYTIDGTNPTKDSEEYDSTIVITQTTVVKAQAFSLDTMMLIGKMTFNTYFINEEYSLAVFSVAADSVIELASGAGDIIPIGSLEYFNVNQEREATSFGSLNRHGQDSWVLNQRSIDWVSRDEMGYSKAVEAPLFSYSDRDEYQKFMFRNSGDDNYPANPEPDYDHEGSTHVRDEYVQTLALEGGMHLDTRAVERVVVFFNGEYWGVYGMRDRPVDHDYTDEYYDQGKYEIQYLSTWDVTEIEYGGEKAKEDWENLRDFILENDMGNAENYQIANDSIDMVSLIDYMIVNLNVVASDWLNYNTGWWRGLNPDGGHQKWGYILWDLDATFDYYINYSGVPNTNPDADPCDLEDISEFMDFFFDNLFREADVGKHEKIFLKLLEESPIFKQLYFSRQADMMNTVYSCENMTKTLDRMLGVIEPEMPRQIERWGGSMDEWQANVGQLKDFISQRCEYLDEGMLKCYDELSGPYEVTLAMKPNGVGTIDLNTITLDSFPWKGDYFGGMDNLLEAKISNEYDGAYKFSHWESVSGHTVFPDSLSQDTRIMLTQADTLIAVFEPSDTTLTLGDIVVNEFMASNDSLSTITDIDGEYEDWIELYNTTTEEIDLSGLYLSDKEDNLSKWKFPTGTTISEGGFLIVWADEDEDQEGLHANFKLSKSGESVFLSDVNSNIIDSVIYVDQVTNLSYARLPNGTGKFGIHTPTFNSNNNEVTSTKVWTDIKSLEVYPNPTDNRITIKYELESPSYMDISLYSILGNKVAMFSNSERIRKSGKNINEISLKEYGLSSGMYLLVMKTQNGQVIEKISIMD